jgi:hypothetical protein
VSEVSKVSSEARLLGHREAAGRVAPPLPQVALQVLLRRRKPKLLFSLLEEEKHLSLFSLLLAPQVKAHWLRKKGPCFYLHF